MSLSAPKDLDDWRRRALDAEAALSGVVIGQAEAIRLMMISVLARGHVLIEGDVGVGKTTLLRAFARAIGGPFARMEGTIDLMPSDLLYSPYIAADGRPRVDPGPILAHGPDLSIFFFNEINRARPQVHALLLRLMAERGVTAFQAEHAFPHLQVFADRNQVERDETFELPAAARDRFMMEIGMSAPARREDRMALAFETRFHDADRLIAGTPGDLLPFREIGAVAQAIQEQAQVSDALRAYVFALWEALRDPKGAGIALAGVDMARLLRGGASPRGISAMVRAARVEAWLNGRDMVLPQDVRRVFMPTIGHRVFLAPVFESRRDEIMPAFLTAVLRTAPAPVAT